MYSFENKVYRPVRSLRYRQLPHRQLSPTWAVRCVARSARRILADLFFSSC